MVYIPKGKDIRTRRGCVCKTKYVSSQGRKYKNQCTIEGDVEPWCLVKSKCGIRETAGSKKGTYWDYCLPKSPGGALDASITYGSNYFLYNFVGIVIFYVIFVFAIPHFLYTRQYNELLEVYLPNFDLLATAVSFDGGPTYKNIFQELYNTESDNLMGFFSTLMINYMALMGVVYLVAMHAKKSRSIATGLGVGIVMVFLTYLLPNEFISYIQGYVATLLRGFLDIADFGPTIYFLVVVVGLGIAGLFILAEKAILARHKTFIDPITKQIVKLAKGRF